MQLYMGNPYDTGHFPFLIHVSLSDKHFVFSGSTAKGDPERVLLVLSDTELADVQAQIRENFTRVNTPKGLWLLDTIFESIDSEEYDQLRECTEVNSEPVLLPVFSRNKALATMALMNSKTGAFFGLSEENLRDGLKAVQIAKKNPEAQQQPILDAAIETVSDLAVSTQNQKVWTHALIALSLIAESNGDQALQQVALQNAAGFAMGLMGSNIPFVYDWVSHQLLSGVALARMISKVEARTLKS